MKRPTHLASGDGGLWDRLDPYRWWSGIQHRRAHLPVWSSFSGVPDDEYQARRSFYRLLMRWARGGTTLDLGCGTGVGLEVLEANGCSPTVGVEWEPRLRRYARRALAKTSSALFADVSTALERGPFDTISLCLDDRPHRDRARIESALWLARRSSACQVVVRRPRAPSAPQGSMDQPRSLDLESVAQRLLAIELGGAFDHLSHYVHLAPPDYDYDPTRQARARAREYQLVPRHQLGVDLDDRSTVADILVASAPRAGEGARCRRLNVGAGERPLAGWLNLDRIRLPGIDIVHDVTHGLGCSGLEAIYSEHFLEHLGLFDALDFLSDARSALASNGLLRLVTPNLDWVWATHYGRAESASPVSALRANRAFYGWEHRFLWNRSLLEEALHATGFRDVSWPERQNSDWRLLRGLEQHPEDKDLPGCPHVLVVDAVKGERAPSALASLRRRMDSEFLQHASGARLPAPPQPVRACGIDR